MNKNGTIKNKNLCEGGASSSTENLNPFFSKTGRLSINKLSLAEVNSGIKVSKLIRAQGGPFLHKSIITHKTYYILS